MSDPNSAVPVVLDAAWLVSIITGAFLPWLIARIQSSQASEQFRAWFAFAACLVAGLLVTFLTRSWTGEWGRNASENIYTVVFNICTLLVAAWQSYSRLWINTTVFQRVDDDPNGIGK